jgi:hypothetical protein
MDTPKNCRCVLIESDQSYRQRILSIAISPALRDAIEISSGRDLDDIGYLYRVTRDGLQPKFKIGDRTVMKGLQEPRVRMVVIGPQMQYSDLGFPIPSVRLFWLDMGDQPHDLSLPVEVLELAT